VLACGAYPIEASENSVPIDSSGDMQESERRFVDAAKQLESVRYFITPPRRSFQARARRLKRTHGLDLLIVDHLHVQAPLLRTA
jgi:replicative DNA helicase